MPFSTGINLFTVATLILLWMKLHGAEWSWWWLGLPVAIEIALGLVVRAAPILRNGTCPSTPL